MVYECMYVCIEVCVIKYIAFTICIKIWLLKASKGNYLCEWQHAELHTYIWHYNISVSTTASSFLVKNTSNESCYRSIMHSSSVNTLCFCLLVFPFINVLPQAGCLIPYPLLIPQGSQHMCICLTETPLRTCSENH